MDQNIQELVAEMPKIELHAHLNGSIGEGLLAHLKSFSENNSSVDKNDFPSVDTPGVLYESDDMEDQLWHDTSNKTRSLKQCWDAFGKIHEVIKTPSILYVATVNVIADFSRENVIYLELRTGAKKIHEIPSKLAYIEAVIKGIQDAQQKFPILVKLLISINRGNGEQDAYDNLKLAQVVKNKYPDIMAGIDISGDPNKGHWSWIVKVMEKAREKGLKISCHLPEIVNPEEGLEFIKFRPERVGHGQFLHPLYGGTERLWELAKETKIPIETCISSNLVSGVAESLKTHIIRIFHKESLPFIICTDDSGVFGTTLSNEYRKFISVVSQITPVRLAQLSLEAASYAFANNEDKTNLAAQIRKWWCIRIGPSFEIP